MAAAKRKRAVKKEYFDLVRAITKELKMLGAMKTDVVTYPVRIRAVIRHAAKEVAEVRRFMEKLVVSRWISKRLEQAFIREAAQELAALVEPADVDVSKYRSQVRGEEVSIGRRDSRHRYQDPDWSLAGVFIVAHRARWGMSTMFFGQSLGKEEVRYSPSEYADTRVRYSAPIGDNLRGGATA